MFICRGWVFTQLLMAFSQTNWVSEGWRGLVLFCLPLMYRGGVFVLSADTRDGIRYCQGLRAGYNNKITQYIQVRIRLFTILVFRFTQLTSIAFSQTRFARDGVLAIFLRATPFPRTFAGPVTMHPKAWLSRL